MPELIVHGSEGLDVFFRHFTTGCDQRITDYAQRLIFQTLPANFIVGYDVVGFYFGLITRRLGAELTVFRTFSRAGVDNRTEVEVVSVHFFAELIGSFVKSGRFTTGSEFQGLI